MDKFVVICLVVVLDLLVFAEAQQRPKILEHPADAVAAREEPLTLNCKAAGRPPPEILWFHNGTPLVPSERRVVLPEGSLFFLSFAIQKGNVASICGTIPPSKDLVLKDDFRLVPRDSVALVGGHVVLNCTPPRGIPEPSVLWYFNGKLLDLSGKMLSMVDQGSLMISEVQSTDAGKYECSAQSMAGSKTEPPAILKVLAPPTIVRGPQDSEVIEGEGLDMPCELTGDPKPIVAWIRDNGKLPEGRSRVLLDNTLRIEDARAEDQGRYICKGHNEGGNVSVAVKLYVYATPSFSEAPVDVELKEGGTIKLPCRAQGRPKPRVIWDRVGVGLSQQISEEVSQFLEEESQEELLAKAKIMSLRSKRERNESELIDTNKENKTSSDSSNDRVKRQILVQSSYPIVKQIPELYIEDEVNRNNQEQNSNFVVSEFRQIMRDVNQETFDTNFRRKRSIDDNSDDNTSSNSTPILFFSTATPTESPSLEVNENGELVLRDVKKKDQGWYACAALNEAGSTVKRIFVRIRSSSDGPNIPQPPLTRWGSDQNIIINSVTPSSAQSLDISWETTEGIPSTSLTLHYRPSSSKDFQTATAMIDSKEYRITDLIAHMEYEVFASVPNGLGGSVSNIRKARTMDGIPSSPPTDVRVGVINNTAAYVRWSPPPSNSLNGELTGYKIQIKSNVTNKLLGQLSLNASVESVVINILSPGGRYIARVAPLTNGGLGPYSPPAPLHMDPSFISRPPKTDPASSGWTSSRMTGLALGILGLCLVSAAIFTVFWARRNKRIMKASYPGPSLTTSLPDKQHSLWLHGNTLLKPMHTISPPQIPSEYAEVTQTILPKNNHQAAPPEPYATVTLQRGAQSDDSCVKCSTSPSSSEYNAPVREPLNICDVLPPPPNHPYGSYKPPNNMTIRTNPAAMSPQVSRRIPPTPPRWGNQAPPIPTFPQNWSTDRQQMPAEVDNNQDCYSENDYESGSVLYEQCCRPNDKNFFIRGGEPTEEYYRNINMEFLEEQEFEPSTPPPPCPDSYNNRINSNLRLLANGQDSPLNNRRPNRSQGSTQSAQSSDSESDNRWAPRSRRSRSRSKSGDRKYLRNGGHN